MEGMNSTAEILRRASYISLSSAKDDKTKGGYYEGIPVPKDKFFLVRALFFLFGMLHLMTITFIVTANNYWMYKFRYNTSQEVVDRDHLSKLQSYFTAGTAVAQAIPTIVCTLLATSYGHKFKVRSRIYVSLGVIFACYLICTLFIEINVDEWQTGFFALTMAILAIIQAMLALFQVTSLVLLAKFPENYMKPFLFGQGIAGIFSSSLQVVCLAIGNNAKTSALIYFSTGSLLIFITIVLFFTVKYLNIYKYYVTLNKEDTKRKKRSYSDSMRIAKEIWPALVIFMTYVATLAATHPSITSLVKSEDYNNGTAWNKTYFVPVITFLFSDICSLVGRICARGFLTQSNGPWMVAINFIRSFLLIPMITLCNASGRDHLPVVFPHDWEYIIILGCLVFTNGFIQNVVFLSVGKLAPGKEEEGLLVLMAFAAVATGVASPLGILIVNIL